MEPKPQLDRIEEKLNYLYNHIVKQEGINTSLNARLDSHLSNHSKCNKAIGFLIGVAISCMTFFKTFGG